MLLQKCCTWRPKGSKRVRRNLRAIAALSRCGRPRGAQPYSHGTAAGRRGDLDVIASCDPADPVTAASQGKRADSYLRFLDTDGARLCVVHQLFTSEDADPGAMARIGPQRERFSPPRANGRCRFSKRTFASTHGNGQDAPSAALRSSSPIRPGGYKWPLAPIWRWLLNPSNRHRPNGRPILKCARVMAKNALGAS